MLMWAALPGTIAPLYLQVDVVADINLKISVEQSFQAELPT